MTTIDAAALYPVDDVTTAVADAMAEEIRRATDDRGRAVLCLAGGSTPLPIYRILAQRRDLPWGRVWLAWGDERNVPIDDDARNEHHARRAWLDRVPVPDDQLLTWPWVEDADPADVAEAYALRLRTALGDPETTSWFDVTLLGLGSDAHTASLFPGTGAVEADGWATSLRRRSEAYARLTLTPRALSSSRQVWFVVTGEAKREALVRTLAGGDADALPATTIRAVDDLRVYTDLQDVTTSG